MVKIPFVIYCRVVPEGYKRNLLINSQKSIVNRITNDVAEYLESNPGRFHLNPNSVLLTPAFDEFPSRVTITGWDNPDIDINGIQPVDPKLVDAPYTDVNEAYHGEPGKSVIGYMATRYPKQAGTIDPRIESAAKGLMSVLADASDLLKDVMRIDYNGVAIKYYWKIKKEKDHRQPYDLPASWQ